MHCNSLVDAWYQPLGQSARKVRTQTKKPGQRMPDSWGAKSRPSAHCERPLLFCLSTAWCKQDGFGARLASWCRNNANSACVDERGRHAGQCIVASRRTRISGTAPPRTSSRSPSRPNSFRPEGMLQTRALVSWRIGIVARRTQGAATAAVGIRSADRGGVVPAGARHIAALKSCLLGNPLAPRIVGSAW